MNFTRKNSQSDVHTAQQEQERPEPTVQELPVEDGHAGNTTNELKVGQVILTQNPGQVVDLQCVVVPVEDRVNKRPWNCPAPSKHKSKKE